MTADQLHSGSNPDLGFHWHCNNSPVREGAILRLHQKSLRKTCGDSGHSSWETPGLIPNPEVKPTHVACCTEVRESSGSMPSCYHLSFYRHLFYEIFHKERMLFCSKQYHCIVFTDTGRSATCVTNSDNKIHSEQQLTLQYMADHCDNLASQIALIGCCSAYCGTCPALKPI